MHDFQLEEIKQQIITEFSPHWQLNDPGHREKHFEEVYQCGLYINERLALEHDPKLILFAAYFHDLFAWSRVNHHEMSYEWIRKTDHPLIVNNLSLKRYSHHASLYTERQVVALACLQHRASYKGRLAGSFSILMSSADRGYPKTPQELLERAVQYRKKHYPHLSEDERMKESIQHIKEKFGSKGKGRFPEYYQQVFGPFLKMQREAVDAL